MPKDKMLSDPILPRGCNLDQESTGILLNPSLPQRENKNCGNLKCAARQCNIADPLTMPIKEIVFQLEACKKEWVFYREHGKRFQRKHLEERKWAAKEINDNEAFANISAIIQREHQ
jgi:hypothetical protein